MKRIIFTLIALALSANAKWVMFSGQISSGISLVFIYNDETGETFSRLPSGGFIREDFGERAKKVDFDGKEILLINNPRDKPKK